MRLSRGSWIFLGVVVVLVGAVFYGLNWVNEQLEADPAVAREPIVFEVPQGATVASLSEDLEEAGVIRSAFFFRLSARNDLGGRLQAGTYDLTTGLSVDEAIDVFREGPRRREVFRFTVREGLTVEETLAALAEQTDHTVEDYRAVLAARAEADTNTDGVLQLPSWFPAVSTFGPDVREPFEGVLFPETYEMFVGVGPQEVLQRMVNQLAATFDRIPNSQVAAFDEAGRTRYDALVIASLIERETRLDAERPTVSGVIANRLEAGQKLDIDATVIYALNRPTERVLLEDLEVESPYNTYRNPGLPPTPISGAGRAAIEAAFAPEDHEFFYYVLTPECDGSHVFAPTLADHNRNVAAFRAADNCGVGTG